MEAGRVTLHMAKAQKHNWAGPAEPDAVRLRRRAGVVEWLDKNAGRWIAIPVVHGLLDRLLLEDKIDESSFLAGQRFVDQFQLAGLGPKYGAVNLMAVRVDGGKQWAEPLGGSPLARAEVFDALDYVGDDGVEYLYWLLGMDQGIETFANTRRIQDIAVQQGLARALSTLDRFYKRMRRHGEGR